MGLTASRLTLRRARQAQSISPAACPARRRPCPAHISPCAASPFGLKWMPLPSLSRSSPVSWSVSGPCSATPDIPKLLLRLPNRGPWRRRRVVVRGLGHEPRHVPAGRLTRPLDQGRHLAIVLVRVHARVRFALVPQHGAEAVACPAGSCASAATRTAAPPGCHCVDAGAGIAGGGHADRDAVFLGHRVAEGRPEAAAQAGVVVHAGLRVVGQAPVRPAERGRQARTSAGSAPRRSWFRWTGRRPRTPRRRRRDPPRRRRPPYRPSAPAPPADTSRPPAPASSPSNDCAPAAGGSACHLPGAALVQRLARHPRLQAVEVLPYPHADRDRSLADGSSRCTTW